MGICDPGNRVDTTGLAFKGSMLQIQLYANLLPGQLNRTIGDAILNGELTVEWVSPMEDDGYREYQDGEFLDRLGLGDFSVRLAEFWPKGGPCWDALGWWTDSLAAGPMLLEAKSYPAEAFTTLAARSRDSRNRIVRSLRRTAEWLDLPDLPASWTTGRYQAANRLAHLYFLREICGLDALLVFACVVDDPTHRGTGLPAWKLANEALWRKLGLAKRPLYTSVIYLPGLRRPPEAGQEQKPT